MSIPRGTTPTFTLTFGEGIDLTQAQKVFVTFESGGHTVTKSGNDLTIEARKISVYLTQKETFMFTNATVEIQANWLINNKRVATEIAVYDIAKQLLKRVIE